MSAAQENPPPSTPTWTRELWQSNDFSDFTIAVSNHEFKVHKAILAKQSKVFEVAFKIDMEESKSGRMEIADFSPRGVKEFLKYFYFGTVTEHGMEVYALADKYDVPNLKSMAEQNILANINPYNALKCLHFGNLHNIESVKAKAFYLVKLKIARFDILVDEEMKNMPDRLEGIINARQTYDEILKNANEELNEAMKKLVVPPKTKRPPNAYVFKGGEDLSPIFRSPPQFPRRSAKAKRYIKNLERE